MKPIEVINKINESVSIKRSDVERTKKYIKDVAEDRTKDNVKQRDIWSTIRYTFGLRRVSSKISKEDKQAYLDLLKELRDYSESINCKSGVRAVDQIIKTSFQGEKFEDKSKLRSKTYYALFSDGGNPYSSLRSSSDLQRSKNWYTAKSDDQTREEFRKMVKSMAIQKAQKNYYEYSTSSIDVMVFDDFSKFEAECKKVGITPSK